MMMMVTDTGPQATFNSTIEGSEAIYPCDNLAATGKKYKVCLSSGSWSDFTDECIVGKKYFQHSCLRQYNSVLLNFRTIEEKI